MYTQYFPNPFKFGPGKFPYCVACGGVSKLGLTGAKGKEMAGEGECAKSRVDRSVKEESFSIGGSEKSKSGNEVEKEEKGAYSKRNVYKSILRSMLQHIKQSHANLSKLLLEKGYSAKEFEHAFYKISVYNDMERKKGSKKKSQTLLKKMVQAKCIYTHILKETLEAIMAKWNKGIFGKISQANQGVYREVYSKYLKIANSLLAST